MHNDDIFSIFVNAIFISKPDVVIVHSTSIDFPFQLGVGIIVFILQRFVP